MRRTRRQYLIALGLCIDCTVRSAAPNRQRCPHCGGENSRREQARRRRIGKRVNVRARLRNRRLSYSTVRAWAILARTADEGEAVEALLSINE